MVPGSRCSSQERCILEECCDHGGSGGLTMQHSEAPRKGEKAIPGNKMNGTINTSHTSILVHDVAE